MCGEEGAEEGEGRQLPDSRRSYEGADRRPREALRIWLVTANRCVLARGPARAPVERGMEAALVGLVNLQANFVVNPPYTDFHTFNIYSKNVTNYGEKGVLLRL